MNIARRLEKCELEKARGVSVPRVVCFGVCSGTNVSERGKE